MMGTKLCQGGGADSFRMRCIGSRVKEWPKKGIDFTKLLVLVKAARRSNIVWFSSTLLGQVRGG